MYKKSPRSGIVNLFTPKIFRSIALTAVSATLLIGLLTSAPEARAASFGSISRIYAFGDSYSDDGNSLEISEQAVDAGVPESTLLPADPALALYDAQGRWTNGQTAIEVLSQALGVGSTNYAVGGATSGRGNFFGWLDPFQDTGVLGQIEQFTAEHAQSLDGNELYFIFASANDFFEYLVEPDPSITLDDVAEQTVDNIAQSIHDLSALGARQFLIINSSDLAALPGASEFEIIEVSERFTHRVNELLPIELTVLSDQLDDVQIALYDHTIISDKIRANPGAYGLVNVDDPCQPILPTEAVCANPDEYYFWDENHPTRRVHQIIGEDMVKFVAAQEAESVPEPAAAISVFILFGLLGPLTGYRH